MTTKQIRHRWDDGGNGRCALGAACDAVGFRTMHMGRFAYEFDGRVAAMFPLLAVKMAHPITHDPEWEVGDIVSDLNDNKWWSRGQIADWVEIIETQIKNNAPTPTKVEQGVA